ncbi:hypothetical protein D3C75_1261380 [compost metagenome]
MSQMGFYKAPDKALRQAVDKQIQSAQQIQQKSQQFVQQKMNGTGDFRQAPNVPQHQPNVHSSYYM